MLGWRCYRREWRNKIQTFDLAVSSAWRAFPPLVRPPNMRVRMLLWLEMSLKPCSGLPPFCLKLLEASYNIQDGTVNSTKLIPIGGSGKVLGLHHWSLAPSPAPASLLEMLLTPPPPFFHSPRLAHCFLCLTLPAPDFPHLANFL
jgi:hypothetical protein